MYCICYKKKQYIPNNINRYKILNLNITEWEGSTINNNVRINNIYIKRYMYVTSPCGVQQLEVVGEHGKGVRSTPVRMKTQRAWQGRAIDAGTYDNTARTARARRKKYTRPLCQRLLDGASCNNNNTWIEVAVATWKDRGIVLQCRQPVCRDSGRYHKTATQHSSRVGSGSFQRLSGFEVLSSEQAIYTKIYMIYINLNKEGRDKG